MEKKNHRGIFYKYASDLEYLKSLSLTQLLKLIQQIPEYKASKIEKNKIKLYKIYHYKVPKEIKRDEFLGYFYKQNAINFIRNKHPKYKV